MTHSVNAYNSCDTKLNQDYSKNETTVHAILLKGQSELNTILVFKDNNNILFGP